MKTKMMTAWIWGLPIALTLSSCIPLLDSFHQGRPPFKIEDTDSSASSDKEEEKTLPVRPNGLFRIKPTYCLCREGKVYTYSAPGYCEKTCADYTSEGNQNTLLIGKVEIANEQLNQSYGQFEGQFVNFCRSIIHEHEKNADCFARLQELHADAPEFSIKEIDIGAGNRFHVTFSDQLRKDRIYSFRIEAQSIYTDPDTGREQTISGYTDRVQFKTGAPTQEGDYGGPLRVGTAKRYYCLYRRGSKKDNIDYAFKQHFIYDMATDPPVIPSIIDFIFCHDLKLGHPDNPLFPRLGEEVAFKVWDKVDRRFGRSSGSNKESDINEFIKKRLLEKHEIQTQGNIALFNPLELPSFPNIKIQTTNAPVNNLAGFYLKPFRAPASSDENILVCPGERELTLTPSDDDFDPVFDVLSEFVGATEALYAALRTPRQFDPLNNTPIDDPFFINETLLKSIWFYRNDQNRPTFIPKNDPNLNNIVTSKTLYFYWPADKLAPTVKKPQQQLYKVRTLEEINKEINPSGDNSGDLPNIIGDRRIGCIPKTDN
ncbi:MAG: hypothetical protein OXB88_06125 [Bacteriovoracales bacterium]|nr:hypothetical protein [Bacteriovoracales bacterium]